MLVGVTDTSYVETVALARHAQESGADAVVLSTPYYFPAGQTELLSYMEQSARRFTAAAGDLQHAKPDQGLV